VEYVEIRVALLLGLRREQLDSRCPLRHLGLDSLMAVELRHHLRRDLEVDVPLPDLLGDLSLADLQKRLQGSPSLGEAAATRISSATVGGWEEMEL
jgi:aryl carrier-like protein